MSDQRACSQIDKMIGARLRKVRKNAALSQQALGQELGISFQQVQKYENGVNRIPASRLCEIARVLEIPVAEFFDDGSQASAYKTEPSATHVLDLFRRIENKELQGYVIGLLKAIRRANDN